ncbi:MAG: cysteine desulfurase [Parcubacteria bacterium C7867-005]|nr:MAG: cysteine desulfurase [Parcubacteria bacterium C7867-005]
MKIFGPKRIYLDYASTTPVLPAVKKEMDRFFIDSFHNPSSIYKEGVEAKKFLENFRTKVARIIGVSQRDIVFTASGTESINLALLGIFEESKKTINKPHIIISAIEHPAVKESAKEAVRRGAEVSIVPVDASGLVSIDEISKIIRPETVLVSVMLANNEIGVIEPVSRISRMVHEYRKKNNSKFPYIHTDASQAGNYIKINLPALGVDLLTLDGSKIYGPKGVGVLVVRPDVSLSPIVFGGGQERGLRSGTENLAVIAGFTKAFELADLDRGKEVERLNKIKLYFIDRIKSSLPKATVNTPEENSLPNIVSVSMVGMLAEFVAIKLDLMGIMVSTGSSCGNVKGSGGTETVVALGQGELRDSTIRFSFGRSTTKALVEKALTSFIKIVEK